METKLVNIIADEALYQLHYYKKFYLTHKKINKKILILFSTITVCLIAFLFLYCLKF